MVWTKEGSYKLANAWWERKLAEITGQSARVEEFHRTVREEDELSRLYREVSDLVRERNQLRNALDAFEAQVAAEEGPEVAAKALAKQTDLDEVLALSSVSSAQSAERTFGHHAERFLALAGGEMKPRSYRQLQHAVRGLYAPEAVGADAEVSSVNEQTVERVYLWLKASPVAPATRKDRWDFFRRLVKYLWSARLIELPRNLDSFSFKVRAKAVRTFPLGDVRACLASLKPRLRLFALLGLNCGMLSVDVASLRKDQVNLTTGRLVRKRVKTEDHADVPTVDYRLWPETLALLTEHWSSHPELALTGATGKPLATTRQEGDRVRVYDGIRQSFRGAKSPVSFKRFRSIAATLLESHATFGRYVGHFLGHSPKSLKDKHYAAPSKELFDQALAWLHDQVLPPGADPTREHATRVR
jgi:integrase